MSDAPKHTTRADWDHMIDSMQSNKESTDNFLDTVRQNLDGLKPEDRSLQLNYITAKLEHEKKLPQLLINSGLTDSKNINFRATTGDTENITYDGVKRMAEKGKNGIDDVNAARQLLATAIVKNFKDIDASGFKNDKVDAWEIKQWTERQRNSSVRMDDGSYASKGEYQNLITQLGSEDKLRSLFGTTRPNKEQIHKAIEQDTTRRQAFEQLGPETVTAAAKKGIIWSPEQRSAAMYLDTDKHYKRIKDSRKEDKGSLYDSAGDWISAEKIAEGGKRLRVSQETINQQQQQQVDFQDLGRKLDEQDKQFAAREKLQPKASGDSAADPKVKTELEQLQKQKEEMNKKLAEMNALLQQLRQQQATKPQSGDPKPESTLPAAPQKTPPKSEAGKDKPESKREPAKQPADGKPEPAKQPADTQPQTVKPNKSAEELEEEKREQELMERLFPEKKSNTTALAAPVEVSKR